MAPPTTTSMNTPMATEPTTSTNSSISSSVDGRGEATKPKAKYPERHNVSERKRRTNIRGEYVRLKEMIPSIKDVDGIEKKEKEVLIAFDKEARDQMARRIMLTKKIEDLQQAIRNAWH